jgi:cytochrome c peroxidase
MPHIQPISLLLAGALFGADPGLYDWHLPKGFPKPLVPADNPVTEPKVRLGRYLFYDTRLSLNGKQSCSTCHRQGLAFTDGRPTSQGATGQNHPRNAMSLVNVAYSAAFGWGGNPALHSLEQQALVPMLSEHPVELGMRSHEDVILNGLRSEPVYPEMFERAFPECAAMGNCFTVANVARALATFVRIIISARSPYDRFHAGGESDAISESAKRGETVFFSDPGTGQESPGARCFRCHGGFNFSDATVFEGAVGGAVPFHNTALYRMYPAPNRGLFEYTRKPSDDGRFKAPTLRNIALTAPYMHDGSIATLDEVLNHYAAGGRATDNPNKDRRIHKIDLTPQNRVDLLAFLRSLTDEEVLKDSRFSNPW